MTTASLIRPKIELARLLTFYGLRWAYEPTTFAVRWGRDGRPVEFVTPDFYLPEHDLYLELTTMRQRLVTRKNRKFRLLREHYPNVRVRMLYLRDFKRLQDVYGSYDMDREARVGTVLFDEREVEHADRGSRNATDRGLDDQTGERATAAAALARPRLGLGTISRFARG